MNFYPSVKLDEKNISKQFDCIWILYFGNAFSRMYFAENSEFGKILKLLLRSNYAQ